MRLTVSCVKKPMLKTEEMQIRRYSPFLESSLTTGNGALSCDEWKAVPDIWRSSAEKFGDRVAVVDPVHSPPSQMTYKQVKLCSPSLFSN